MVGKEQEHQGIAKHGAKMVTAVSRSCAMAPKFTILILACAIMVCVVAHIILFFFCISVMGGDNVAVNCIVIIKRKKFTRR